MLGDILASGVLVDVPDVVDGPADGIQKGGAAADDVVLFRHGGHLLNGHPVVDDRAGTAEEDRGNKGLALLFFLLFDQGIEAADGIRLQPAHGAAAVQDKDDLRQVLFHVPYLQQKM